MSAKSFFHIISETLKPTLKNQDEFFISLLENWSHIVPKSWEKNAYPVKFKWVNNKQATLVLKLKSLSQVVILNFESPGVIKQINSFFGHEVVIRIVFINH